MTLLMKKEHEPHLLRNNLSPVSENRILTQAFENWPD